jgi:hypothetical protein
MASSSSSSSAVLLPAEPPPPPPAAAAAAQANAAASSSRYLNNAELVFEYTIDYEVGDRSEGVRRVRGSAPLPRVSLYHRRQHQPTSRNRHTHLCIQSLIQDEAKLHQGIRNAAREIVGGWQVLRDEDLVITVISTCWRDPISIESVLGARSSPFRTPQQHICSITRWGHHQPPVPRASGGPCGHASISHPAGCDRPHLRPQHRGEALHQDQN